jgi:hypothetical protein
VAPLRILDPDAAEERARNRQMWADLWQAIAYEANADRLDDARDDEEVPAETAA